MKSDFLNMHKYTYVTCFLSLSSQIRPVGLYSNTGLKQAKSISPISKTCLSVQLTCHNVPISSLQSLSSALLYRHFSHLLIKNLTHSQSNPHQKPRSAKFCHWYAGHKRAGIQVHFVPENRNYSCSFLMLHYRL